MKFFKTLFFSIIFFSGLWGQVPTPAPDFTLEDINGVSHSLYQDYLNEGKVVVLDFSTTWCGPCWGLHAMKTLDHLYEALGPDGTDDVVVLWVESDSTTTMDDLNGPTAKSYGDWVTGVKYPIFDGLDASLLASEYNVGSFPTIVLIAPDGTVLDNNLYPNNTDLETVYNKYKNLVPDSGEPNEARFFQVESDTVSCGGFVSTVKINNNGTDPIENLEIDIYRNGEFYKSQSYNSSFDSKEIISMELEGLEIDEAVPTNLFKVVLPDDGVQENNEVEFSIKRTTKTYGQDYSVFIDGDSYAEDDGSAFTVLRSSDGAVVFEKQNLKSGENLFEFTLSEPDCYQFVLLDDFGDGWYNPIHIVSGTDTIFSVENLLFFKNHRVYVENVMETSVEENVEINEFKVSPTLVSDDLTIDYYIANQSYVDIFITNTLGQRIMNIYSQNETKGHKRKAVDVSMLNSGRYWISIQTDSGVETKSILKQ